MILTDTKLGRWNMAAHRWESTQAVLYNGKKVLLDARDSKGVQESIFDDGMTGAFYIEIRRLPDPEEEKFLRAKYGHLPKDRWKAFLSALSRIEIGEIEPYYIMRYGFYEGHTAWRTDPVAIAFIFGLRNLEEIEKAFPGRSTRFWWVTSPLVRAVALLPRKKSPRRSHPASCLG